MRVVVKRRKSRWPVHRGRKMTVAHKRKSVWVARRKDLGLPGKGKKVIPIKKGILPEGILNMPLAKGKKAAVATARKKGAKRIFAQLRAMETVRAPVVAGKKRKRTKAILEDYRKAKALRTYVGNKFSKQLTPRAAIRSWSKMSHKERARRMPGG